MSPARDDTMQSAAASSATSTREAPAPTAGDQKAESRREWLADPGARLLQGLAFGIIFGFLLQKGGVGKYHILVGVMLLEDFTVVKVMLTAIVTGMVGVYLLDRWGVLKMQPKETVYGANIIGGLIFGIGFGLLAYCPGTDAAAVGQGNYDAIVGILGLMAGSYLFAEMSGFFRRNVSSWGDRGELTLPKLLGISHGKFVALAAPVLVLVLVLLEIWTVR